ncbi:MAG: aromatic ring-hydroxylating dioxygenase subunit alpha [Proteobacteria bacterium]|nr:aromatic ring-hydroxylating dioxygenase subunit alpha [Pseudomonadota bacterium]
MSANPPGSAVARGTTLHKPYDGYQAAQVPAPDWDLTSVGPGTACGSYFRRFWHPVALSRELSELPLALRILGEDLVLYRDTEGRVGLLDRHCAHRGTSLEFGVVEATGLRCCYHGWLYAADGTVLEAPGEPAGNKIAGQLKHRAYPTYEYQGLIFAYMGHPDDIPAFPIFDTFELPENKLVPYAIAQPCNWLQVQENAMDQIHAVYLHTLVGQVQLSSPWGEIPTYEFVACGDSMYYITGRRVGDMVWVRSGEIIFPNLVQTGSLWEEALAERFFSRVSLSRWDVPIDDLNTMAIGWRHFNDSVDPNGLGREDLCGRGSVDFPGQTGDRPYEERQRDPGDWDAQCSQRPIAVHAMEHLGATDRGVALHRQLIRKAIDGGIHPRGIAERQRPKGGLIPTHAHDTILYIPAIPGSDDRQILLDLGRRVLDAIVSGDNLTGAVRQRHIETGIGRLSKRK